ncbi:hypothetical protein QQ965_02775 [Candidatus Saccharibacteria bacterium oral taxon 955]
MYDLDIKVNRSVDMLTCAYDYLKRRGQSLVRPGFGRGCKHGSKYLRARRRSEHEVRAMREEIASEIEYRVRGGC